MGRRTNARYKWGDSYQTPPTPPESRKKCIYHIVLGLSMRCGSHLCVSVYDMALITIPINANIYAHIHPHVLNTVQHSTYNRLLLYAHAPHRIAQLSGMMNSMLCRTHDDDAITPPNNPVNLRAPQKSCSFFAVPETRGAHTHTKSEDGGRQRRGCGERKRATHGVWNICTFLYQHTRTHTHTDRTHSTPARHKAHTQYSIV